MQEQAKQYIYTVDSEKLIVKLRFDDRCKNGHCTFSITGELYENDRWECGGCIHDNIERLAPQFSRYIKWHLCSTDGPLHYIANTTYWAKEGNLEYARSSAIWPNAALDDLLDEQKLKNRLSQLLKDFRLAMEELGFNWNHPAYVKNDTKS